MTLSTINTLRFGFLPFMLTYPFLAHPETVSLLQCDYINIHLEQKQLQARA